MAGDWIKWQKGLAHKREVVRIAHKLGVDRFRVAVACMEVWEWADNETEDGHIEGVPVGAIDDVAGLDGFGVAMRDSGWLRTTEGGISFPNFERHNGESAKKRARDAKRKRSVRKMSAPKADKTTTREEKRREEETTTAAQSPSLPDARVVDEILSAFPSEGIPGDARHVVHRRSIAEGVRMLADSPPSDFRGHPPFAAGDSSGAAAWALARTREYAGSAAAASHCMNLRTFFVGTAERPAGVMDDSRRWRDRDAKPKAPPSTADVVAAAVRDGSYRQWPTDRLERYLHALLEVGDERALRAEYERRTA